MHVQKVEENDIRYRHESLSKVEQAQSQQYSQLQHILKQQEQVQNQFVHTLPIQMAGLSNPAQPLLLPVQTDKLPLREFAPVSPSPLSLLTVLPVEHAMPPKKMQKIPVGRILPFLLKALNLLLLVLIIGLVLPQALCVSRPLDLDLKGLSTTVDGTCSIGTEVWLQDNAIRQIWVLPHTNSRKKQFLKLGQHTWQISVSRVVAANCDENNNVNINVQHSP